MKGRLSEDLSARVQVRLRKLSRGELAIPIPSSVKEHLTAFSEGGELRLIIHKSGSRVRLLVESADGLSDVASLDDLKHQIELVEKKTEETHDQNDTLWAKLEESERDLRLAQKEVAKKTELVARLNSLVEEINKIRAERPIETREHGDQRPRLGRKDREARLQLRNELREIEEENEEREFEEREEGERRKRLPEKKSFKELEESINWDSNWEDPEPEESDPFNWDSNWKDPSPAEAHPEDVDRHDKEVTRKPTSSKLVDTKDREP